MAGRKAKKLQWRAKPKFVVAAFEAVCDVDITIISSPVLSTLEYRLRRLLWYSLNTISDQSTRDIAAAYNSDQSTVTQAVRSARNRITGRGNNKDEDMKGKHEAIRQMTYKLRRIANEAKKDAKQ